MQREKSNEAFKIKKQKNLISNNKYIVSKHNCITETITKFLILMWRLSDYTTEFTGAAFRILFPFLLSLNYVKVLKFKFCLDTAIQTFCTSK